MLIKIGLENFKSFKSYTEIDLKTLTVLSGNNSSGKSSIYQAILVLVQSSDKVISVGNIGFQSLAINGDFIRIGKKEDLLADKSKQFLRFCLWMSDGSHFDYKFTILNKKINEDFIEDFILTEFRYSSQDLSLDCTFSCERMLWDISASSLFAFQDYHVRDSFISVIQKKMKVSGLDFKEVFSPEIKFCDVDDVKFSGLNLSLLKIKTEMGKECLRNELRESFDADLMKKTFAISGIKEIDSFELVNIESEMHFFNKNNIALIPAFRGHPLRAYTEGDQPNPLFDWLARKNEKVVYRYSNEEKSIKDDTLEGALNYWIADYFKLADRVSVRPLLEGYSTEIILLLGEKEIPINNMGFGVGQILPVIFKIIASGNERLIIVDEPEIHLHPQLQSKLGHFFSQMALIGKNILLETHSEPLLHNLIYSHLENDEIEERVQMLWVERDIKQGSTSREIMFDELGYLLNPPDGFLDERKKINEFVNKLRARKLNNE